MHVMVVWKFFDKMTVVKCPFLNRSTTMDFKALLEIDFAEKYKKNRSLCCCFQITFPEIALACFKKANINCIYTKYAPE